jgi:carboxypeptidase family protein
MKNAADGALRIARVFPVLALILLAAAVASGQTFRGTILGTVTDASGASVPGATVTVRNADTGLVRTTETQTDGSYRVPELPIGMYEVTIEKSNFRTSVTKAIQLDVAAERRVDAALELGAINEQVLVSGEALPQIETTSDTLGGTLTQENRKGSATQRAGLHKAHLLEPRRGRLARSDHGLSGIIWGIFHEWGPRPVQQLSARRHGHERWLPE